MDFESLEQRYAAWRLLYDTGDITREEFERRTAGLTGSDAHGNQWRIDAQTGGWLRLEGAAWVEDDPHTWQPSPHDAGEPAPPPKQPRVTFGEWLRDNWGWIAVAGVAVVLIGVAVLVLQIIQTTPTQRQPPAVASSPPTPQPGGGPTSAPVDISVPPTPTPPPTSAPQNQFTDHGHPMILIPAGPFRMGSTEQELATSYEFCKTFFVDGPECDEQGFETETPAHEVTLDSYYIDRYEVTNTQYAAFLNELQNRTEGGTTWLDVRDEQVRVVQKDGSWQALPDFADRPVTEVTWYGARAYCDWREARLPTEAEWEKAARWNPETGDVLYYPWGDARPSTALANFLGTFGSTTEVGNYPQGASPSGVLDMAGNVFEWTNDWFDPAYYAESESTNPQGPADGTLKAIRGGSWGDFPFLLHAANRGSLAPSAALNFVGFRCAKDVETTAP